MLSRPIPSTGEAMPVIGLGTWPVFDVGAAEAARRPLRDVVLPAARRRRPRSSTPRRCTAAPRR